MNTARVDCAVPSVIVVPILAGIVLWIFCWAVVAASSGVVWEFAVHRPLRPDLVYARGVIVFLSFACAVVPVFLLDLLGSVAQFAWDKYPWSFARWVVAFAAVLFLAITIPYAWFAVFLLKGIWPRILQWSAEMESKPLSMTMEATWTAWALLSVATAALTRFVVSIARSNPFYAYQGALGALGLRRCLAGICLMAYFRLLLPRRDFFVQAPIVSWMPGLALAVLLHETIPIRVFAIAIPTLLLMLAVPFWSSFVAPPLWIFLGTSDFDSFRTFYDLRASWRRHGLTLLNRVGEGGLEFYAAWRSSIRSRMNYDPSAGRVWSLRTRPQMWQTVVRSLAAFVPVIVMDVRQQSDHLKFEIDWLARRDFMNKVYMIVSHDAGGEVHTTAPTRVDENTLMQLQWNKADLVSAETSPTD